MCTNLLPDHLHNYSIQELQIPSQTNNTLSQFMITKKSHSIGKCEIGFSGMSYNILFWILFSNIHNYIFSEI